MSEYFVTCSRMKILEQNTDAAGLSYYQMMENAGRIAANRIIEITMAAPLGEEPEAKAKDVAVTATSPINDVKNRPEIGPHKYPYALDRPLRTRIYCGKGNNGGDGFVVARLLHDQGWETEIVLVDGEPSTPDAITNCELAMELGIPMKRLDEIRQEGTVFSDRDSGDGSCEASFGPDVVVDAIYGTGFHGSLRENGVEAARQIAEARSAGARIFALDIPSGMGGDLEKEEDLDSRCVKADVTITFHAKKLVHLQNFAGKYCGQIITADIGIVDPERDKVLSADTDALAEGAPGSAATGSSGFTPAEDPGQAAAGAHRPEMAGAPDKAFDLQTGERYTFDDFVGIIAKLRAPDGCPWDREQTHETLRKYLLEETQEAAEAIDNKDDANLCEELGDVLLQIVLNAQIGKERGAFSMDDVIQGVSEKMIRRHPWVFGDMHVDTPEEGERLWEEIKKKEKSGC